jgi:hypothetical protein
MSTSVSNPFCTARTRPGALSYLFPPGTDAEQLVAQLRGLDWWAQIIGEHGSGKSTLLQTLRPLLERAERRLQWYALHSGESRLPHVNETRCSWDEQTLVVIDGYEQLGWLVRRNLRDRCRRRKAGLLVTAHRPLRLPVLWRTEPSLGVAQAVVSRLLPTEHAGIITPEDVAVACRAHGGNLRETLFALYDVFESRKGGAPLPSS